MAKAKNPLTNINSLDLSDPNVQSSSSGGSETTTKPVAKASNTSTTRLANISSLKLTPFAEEHAPIAAVDTPAPVAKKQGIIGRVLNSVGNFFDAPADTANQENFTPSKTATKEQTQANIAEQNKIATAAAAKDKLSFGNVIKEIPSQLVEHLPFGVGSIFKEIHNIESTQPDALQYITTKNILKAVPKGVKDFAVNQVIKPVISPVLTAAGIVKGKIRSDSNSEIKFNVPGLGEVSNVQARVVDRVLNGEDPTQVGIEEGVGELMNGLWLYSIVKAPFTTRSSTVADITPEQSVKLNARSNTIGETPESATMRSFREYKPPTIQTPVYTELNPAMVERLQSSGVDLAKYDPAKPTYFRFKMGDGGQITGEVVQVKPSFYDTLKSKFGGKIEKAPESAFETPLYQKSVSDSAFAQGAKSVEVVPKGTSAPVSGAEAFQSPHEVAQATAMAEIGSHSPAQIRESMPALQAQVAQTQDPAVQAPLIAKLNTVTSVFNTYADQYREPVISVAGKDAGNPAVSIEVLPFNDGKFAVSIDVNTADSGLSKPFSVGETYLTREAAIGAARKQILQWVAEQQKSPNTADTKTLELISNEVKKPIEKQSNDDQDSAVWEEQYKDQYGELAYEAYNVGEQMSQASPAEKPALQKRLDELTVEMNKVKEDFSSHGVAEKKLTYEIMQEVVASHPAAPLQKYMALKGDYKGKLPEVTGKSITNRWVREGDQIAAELGFKDAEDARNSFDDYVKQKKELAEMKPEKPKSPAKSTPKKVLPSSKAKEADGGEVLGFNPKNITDPFSKGTAREIAKDVKRSEIANTLSQKLGVPIRIGKFSVANAAGIFKTREKLVRLKGGGKSGGLPTVFHEVGHFLDDKFAFSQDIPVSERKPLMVEYGYSYDGQPNKQRMEAFAEFLRYYMTGQEARLQKIAPRYYKTFTERIAKMPEINDVINTAREDYARWKEMPAAAKVFSQLSIGEQKDGVSMKDKLSYGLHSLYTQAVDDLHPLDEFSKLAKKNGVTVPAKDDPYILARNLRGWVGRADTFLTKGTFGKDFYKTDAKGKVVPNFNGKSFDSIVRPIEHAGNLNDFRTYLVAQRVIELADRKIISGITRADAQEAIDELKAKHPEFARKSQDLYDYQSNLLNYAYENGLIDRDSLSKMKELNRYRVPFYRVMEEAQSAGKFMGKKIGNTISPIKSIKGSDRDIIDPIESIVKDTFAIISAADRNQVGAAMVKLAKEHFELGRLVEEVAAPMAMDKVNVGEVLNKALSPEMVELLADSGVKPETLGKLHASLADTIVSMFKPSMFTANGDITVLLDGKKKTYHVDPQMYKAIQGLDQEDVGTIIKVMSLPAKFLRAGATLSPDFAVRNPLRDQFSAFVYSKGGYFPPRDFMKGIYETFKKGDAYDLWKMSGGEHATMVSVDRDGLQNTLKDVLKTRKQEALSYVKNPLKLLQVLSSFGEQATRLGEMKRVLQKTGDPTAAAYASREVTIDFARIGAKTKAVNHLIAFWNANVGGLDKMARQFKNNPRGTWLKLLLAITLPSILLYYANRKDPRWKEIPQWQKNLFWIVMTKDHIYRVPKPFELGILFGSVPERILENIDTHSPEIFDQLEHSVMDGMTPGFIPTGILPIIENMSNYSFFADRPIVSPAKQNLPNEAQFDTYTTETAKFLGQKFGYSPDKIDNLINGYFGGLGNYATGALDGILKETGISHAPSKPAATQSDIPALKAFVIRDPVGSGSESVNNFYDLWDQATAGKAYVTRLVKDGTPAEVQQAKDYIAKHPEIKLADEYSAIASIFSDFSKARDQVRNSDTLSREQKRDALAKIDKKQTEIAQKALTFTLKDNE